MQLQGGDGDRPPAVSFFDLARSWMQGGDGDRPPAVSFFDLARSADCSYTAAMATARRPVSLASRGVLA